ncbi:MAG: DUF3300 domain-containing protein [Candidatus Acidiferrales bacterium]
MILSSRMPLPSSQVSTSLRFPCRAITLLCALAMIPAAPPTFAGARQNDSQPQYDSQSQDNQQVSDTPLLASDQLDDLVTPIALYSDPLIAQILAASTYPLEVVQANRWLQSNSGLQDTALTDAARNQSWDPSVQALVVFPSVLDMMDRNLAWTTDLGNAFLAQEQDVMDAIQRQRSSAAASGNLASNSEQTVERSSDSGKTVIIIQPAQPEVVYVPVYNPVVIWGPPRYHPWPSFWYPPRPRGAVVWVGGGGFFIYVPVSRYFVHWGGWGGWGWGCGWHSRNIVINNNFYIRNNYRPPHGVIRNGRTPWAHNPNHRAGVPYPNRRVADRVGGPTPRPRPGTRPTPGKPGVRPSPQPGRPNGPGSRPTPGQPTIQPAPNPGRPGTRPSPGNPNTRPTPGNPSIQPVPQPNNPGTRPTPGNPNAPGTRPNPGGRPAPGGPTIQPVPNPGSPNSRPNPRPAPDRTAWGTVNQPGGRAEIERDRGYSSLGNRVNSRPATQPKPAAQPNSGAKPAPAARQAAAPKPSANSNPDSKPARPR